MMKTNWQQQIDEELGKPKWNDELSNAIQQQALQLEEASPNTPVFIPFISVAILTIAVFLSLSFLPNLRQGDQAALQDIKFQKVYYSKLPAEEGQMNAQENLATVGMTQTSDSELLSQLSIAYEQKKPIDPPNTDHSESMSIILYDDDIAYPFNIYRTFTDEVIFEYPHYTFYKYSGNETSQIFALLDKQFNLKTFLIMTAIFIMIEISIPFAVRKYYAMPKRKETFDNITFNRIARWAPLPYLFYVNFKLAYRPLTLTWWEILIPFIVYQIVVLLLMKQQKEPHPYIVERMLSFIVALLFIIICMFML